MRKLFIALMCIAASYAIGQVPTYKWVSGSQEVNVGSDVITTEPGPRIGSTGFIDSAGKLWFHGGQGHDATGTEGFFGDTWSYDPAEDKWSWEAGQMTVERFSPEYNNSLSFDGVDDQIVLDNNPVDFNEDFTVELWFKTSSNGTIVSFSPEDDDADFHQGWTITLYFDELHFFVNGNSRTVITSESLLDDQWHHVAVTYERGGQFSNNQNKFYLDGELVVEDSYFLSLNGEDNHKVIIGAERAINYLDETFAGQIDELRFWDYARNGGEIGSNRSVELNGDEEGLAAYYQFNQGEADFLGNSESQLLDSSPSENHGTIGDIFREGVFIGQMSSMRVWSRYMSDTEILQRRDSVLVGNEDFLAMAYDFQDGIPNADNSSLDSLNDISDNNRKGSLENFEKDGESSNIISSNSPPIRKQYVSPNQGEILLSGDMNEDGFDDLISSNSTSISIMENDGNGGFENSISEAAPGVILEIAVGEVNDDDFLDIVAVGHSTGDDDFIRIFHGDGSGGVLFTSDIDPGDGTKPVDVKIADFNGDTFDDIIVTLLEEDKMRIYFSDGANGFTNTDYNVGQVAILVGNENYLTIADYNNDDWPDVVTRGYFESSQVRLNVFLNDGTGTLDSISSTQSSITRRVYPSDINNDGNMDIVSSYNYLGYFLGNGDGTFQSGVETNTGEDINKFVLRDVNQDSNVDVISITNDQAKIILGDGNTGFHESEVINNLSSITSLNVSDFNDDKFLDFAFLQYSRVEVFNGFGDGFKNTTQINVLDFDGLDDFVEIPNLRPFDDNFTIEGWIKTEDNGPIFSFAPEDDSYNWGDNGTGSFSLAIKEGKLTFIAEGIGEFSNEERLLLDGEWHHIAATFFNQVGDDYIQLFVDGIYVADAATLDFFDQIAFANTDYASKLGAATNDFKSTLGSTGQNPTSNWTAGVDQLSNLDGRGFHSSWTNDNGDMYFFGGVNLEGTFNTIERFNADLGEWETFKGSGIANDPGEYGDLQIASGLNAPPSRTKAAVTLDELGAVWIYGGDPTNENLEQYSDLWMFDFRSKNWTWMSGTDSTRTLPVHGTLGISDPSNTPGAREYSSMWVDGENNLWLFGGEGTDQNGDPVRYNDLWKFNTSSYEWTWIGGGNAGNEAGVYGELGIASSENYPGARESSLSWIDSEGTVWLFGGYGLDKFGSRLGQLNDLWAYDQVENNWIWHSGSDFVNSTGSYIKKGISSPDYVPGARDASTGWIDDDNNLWVFAGFKTTQFKTGRYNDFWKFNTVEKEWTWYSGYDATTDLSQVGEYGNIEEGSEPHPGARHGALTWHDSEGSFWIQGGAMIGTSSNGMLNDLWKYDQLTNKWEYYGGNTELELNDGNYGSRGVPNTSNEPRSRWHGASWVDSQDRLWFFGGLNENQAIGNIGWINDLWMYDPAQRVYTWMGGSEEVNGSAVYGDKGESSAAFIPGARGASAFWTDEDGLFWLFGGYESFEYNNDIWTFNPTTLEWTWVSGNDFQNTPGIYGEQGVEAEENSIGARRYMSPWVADDGMVYIFGGHGIDSQGLTGEMNDLWRYNPTTNRWTWLNGSQNRYASGSYGELGVPHPDNQPGARAEYVTWKDDSNNLWMFGGREVNEITGVRRLNDLWRYSIESNIWTWMGGDSIYVEPEYGDIGTFSENNILNVKARAQAFKGADKNFFLFGGRETSSSSHNDLWEIKFTPGVPEVESPFSITQSQVQFTQDEPWAKSYEIELSTNSEFTEILYAFSIASDSTSIVNLDAGSRYYYRVKAFNEIGESDYGDGMEVLTLPNSPELDFDVNQISSTSALVGWFSAEGIIDGFLLDVSTDPTFVDNTALHSQYSAEELSSDLLNTQLTDLTPGTIYYTRIRTFNSTGESPNSNVISFLTTPEAPSINTFNSLTQIDQTTAIVNWEDVDEIFSAYQVIISTDSTFVDESSVVEGYNYLIVSKENSELALEGLQKGTQYFIRIFAYNDSGLSEPSETIKLLTLPESPIFEAEVSLSEITQNSVVLNWTAPSEIYDGYRLQVSTDFGFGNTSLMLPGYGRGGNPKEIEKESSSDTLRDLSPGQTYFARVRSYNSSGGSPFSNILTIGTVPESPNFNTPNNISQTNASLSWSSPSGAEVYLLDLNTSEDFDSSTTILSEFPSAVTFQVLSDLTPGTRYFARVQSRNSNGDSGDMDPADYDGVTFITIPATPILNDPDQYSQTSIHLSWDEVEGAAGYEVDVSDNFFQTFLPGYSSLEIVENQFVIENLESGEEYQFRVRSKNSSGESPNAGNFDLKTIPGTPTARDATNVSTSVFTTNWDASNGADYYALEVSLDDFTTFHFNETVVSPNPVQMNDLTPGTTYKYRVKAGNSSGESPYSNEVTVIAQNNAQSLSIGSIEHVSEFSQNQLEAEVTVNLSGGLGTAVVTYRHRPITQPTWSEYQQAAEVSASEFAFTVTAAMLDDIGVAFEVYANDGVTFIESLGNTITKGFTEQQSETLPNLSFNDWQMISIPYQLDNKSVTAIFSKLGGGEFNGYKKKWRIMNYRNGEYLDAGIGFNSIELGVGYWFYSKNEVDISLGAGTTNSAIPFTMPLEQGWNQIGNPYNTTINWDQILRDNGVSTVVDDLLTYDVRAKEYRTNTSLNAFQGAFVWSDAALDLQVSPVDGEIGNRVETTGEIFNTENGDWKMSMVLNTGGSSKEVGAIGMHSNAGAGKDHFDKMAIPRFQNYLEMYSSNDAYFYPYFSTDIVSIAEEHVWNLSVESNYVEGEVLLEWDPTMLSPIGNTWLVDEEKGKVVLMNTNNSHSVVLDKVHQLSIHYSTDPAYTVIPSKLILGDAYPNPMNFSTTVPLILPEKDSPYDVNLVLMDLQGKEVMKVMEGSFEAGIYELNMNVENEAIRSGVYILQLNFKDPSLKSQQKKIVKK